MKRNEIEKRFRLETEYEDSSKRLKPTQTDSDNASLLCEKFLNDDDSLFAILNPDSLVQAVDAVSLRKTGEKGAHNKTRKFPLLSLKAVDIETSKSTDDVLSLDVISDFQNDNFTQFFETNGENCASLSQNFSQFCESTQVLQQIETVMDSCELISASDDNPKRRKVSTTVKEAISHFKDEENWNETLASGISQLFKSSQYKREVADVFDQLETTICQISAGQDASLRKNEAEAREVNQEKGNVGMSEAIRSRLMKNVQNPQMIQSNAGLNQGNVDMCFTEMGPFYGLPLRVKGLIQQYKGIENLYDWQDECLQLPAIRKRKNLVYALPTSGGKTLVSEILILREVLCRRHNVLFILPYVSIVQEKVWALSPFALALDFLVEEYAAGKGGYPPRRRRHKHSVYIATIEKALSLVNSLTESGRLDELGLVVVDELHLLGEGSRGATLETLLTKLMHSSESIHVVGMSATIGNLEEVCEYLKADVYTKDFRPVELKEFVKCGVQIAEVNRKTGAGEDALVPVRTVDFQYSEDLSKIDPDHLGGLVQEVIPSGSCLIFCASKKNCENVSTLLSRILPRSLQNHNTQQKQSLLSSLRGENLGALCPVLRRTIPYGVAYHHSGLTADERRFLEDAFRVGILCVICCTSTLAAGVNLPARRVLIRSPYVGRSFLSLTKYKQMAGRAGRAGLGDVGECILLCENRDLQKVKELLCAPMDRVESHLAEDDGRGLKNLVLSSIALGTAKTRRTLRKVASCTLLNVQQERLSLNLTQLLDQTISKLFKLGALQVDTDKKSESDINTSILLQCTLMDQNSPKENSEKKQIVIGNDSQLVISKLGKAAIKGGLNLDTAHLLYDDLVQAQTSLVLLNCLHLLYLVTPYDLATQIQPSLLHYYTVFVELGPKELQTARILGLNEACEAALLAGRRIKTVSERVLNRFYLTLMIYDMWNGQNVFTVADKYQVSRGLVQQLLVSATTFTGNVVRFCEQLDDEFWAFVELLRGLGNRLHHCGARELEPLLALPAVKEARARQLFNAGFKTLQSVAKADSQELVQKIEYMTRRVANQLIASAKLLLLERVENLREEAEDVLEGIETSL